MADTKLCEACDAEIGKDETKCPKCGVDFSELEETVSAVEKAQAVLERRRAKAAKDAAEKVPQSQPAEQPKGAARLRSLGRAFQKKG